jgi:hypothetical protein
MAGEFLGLAEGVSEAFQAVVDQDGAIICELGPFFLGA